MITRLVARGSLPLVLWLVGCSDTDTFADDATTDDAVQTDDVEDDRPPEPVGPAADASSPSDPASPLPDDGVGTDDGPIDVAPVPADDPAETDDPEDPGDPVEPGGPVEPGPAMGPGDPSAPAPSGLPLIPGRIEAEEFVRFEEQDVDNDVNDCMEPPVDTAQLADGEGCFVGWTQPGEWLEYDVRVEAEAEFELTLQLASMDPGQLEVVIDEETLGFVPSPAAGWENYVSVMFEDGIRLAAGEHTVRVAFAAGQTNIDYLEFALREGSEPGEPAEPLPSVSECSAPAAGYQLVWSDEFDYVGLPDPRRWGYETGGDGWGNNELQFYTEGRAQNASVADGVLSIVAVHEDYEGNEYTSAKLNSGLGEGNAGTWNEGIFQVRARLPSGLGTWPALWMMPTECTEGWPNCGEIDVMEHVGYDAGVVHGTIHTDAFNHVEGTQNGGSTSVPEATSEFHTYTLVWTTDRLEWQVDGVVYHAIDRASDWGFAEWPFDEKLWHLMINVAVGGNWGGAEGVNSEDFPATFQIDAVCVYQRE